MKAGRRSVVSSLLFLAMLVFGPLGLYVGALPMAAEGWTAGVLGGTVLACFLPLLMIFTFHAGPRSLRIEGGCLRCIGFHLGMRLSLADLQALVRQGSRLILRTTRFHLALDESDFPDSLEAERFATEVARQSSLAWE